MATGKPRFSPGMKNQGWEEIGKARLWLRTGRIINQRKAAQGQMPEQRGSRLTGATQCAILARIRAPLALAEASGWIRAARCLILLRSMTTFACQCNINGKSMQGSKDRATDDVAPEEQVMVSLKEVDL